MHWLLCQSVSGPQLIPSQPTLLCFFFSSLSEPGPAHCHACAQSSTPNTPSQFATAGILAVCSVIVLVKPFDAQSWRILLSLSSCLVVQAHFKWRKYHTSNRRHLLFLTQHSPRSRNMQIVWKLVCQIIIELERQGGGKKRSSRSLPLLIDSAGNRVKTLCFYPTQTHPLQHNQALLHEVMQLILCVFLGGSAWKSTKTDPRDVTSLYGPTQYLLNLQFYITDFFPFK